MRRPFQNLGDAEVTRLKHQKVQSLLTSAATFLRRLAERAFRGPPSFAKYRPAPRLGERRIEGRLLQRLDGVIAETPR